MSILANISGNPFQFEVKMSSTESSDNFDWEYEIPEIGSTSVNTATVNIINSIINARVPESAYLRGSEEE